jgi:2-polyprenyl-3-methyl-5-hydroxy-6-metoxy-1,4-benzoquinol methylase
VTQTVDHYKDEYWNDLPRVISYLCRRSTGDESLWWMDYFKKIYATPPRKRALVFGCGNGWVERDLYDRGIAEHFDAFDASSHYLETAERQRGSRSITYRQANFDDYVPDGKYDLMVNVASLHHVRFLFRMSHVLANALEPDGLFVHWEYVGPSRNQYSDDHLALLHAINHAMPVRFRTSHPLRHELSTFLAGDPTEAIHSADIVHALEHHFETIEFKPLCGGLAYPLLWNNLAEFRKGDAEAAATLEWLLRLDEAVTDSGVVPTLFAFMTCKPRRHRRPAEPLDRLLREPMRERIASWTGGRYAPELLRDRRRLHWLTQLLAAVRRQRSRFS